MIRGLRVLAVILALLAGGARAERITFYTPDRHVPGNLVLNGDFDDMPPMQGEGVPAKAGSSAIKNWDVLLDVYCIHSCDSIPGGGYICLCSSGAISQKVPTQSGQTYELSFYLAGVTMGPPVKTVQVQAGSSSQTFSVEPAKVVIDPYSLINKTWWHPLRTMVFTASGASTTIVFRGLVKDFHGPLIADVAVVPLDPAALAIRQMQPLYDGINACLQRRTYRYLLGLTTADFTLKLADGSTVSREGYEAYLKQQEKAGGVVSIEAKHLSTTDGKTAVADVEKKNSYTANSDDGASHRYQVITQMQDTWTKAGPEEWKLAASVIQKETTTVDGQPQPTP